METIAAEEIGRETVGYVANVNKYYIAYRLGFEAERRRLTTPLQDLPNLYLSFDDVL